MRASDRAITWEDFDGALVANLPVKFRMSEIERYTGIDCPHIHLTLYSTIMRAHGLDEAQMEFLRQFAFNTVIDVSRREFEALRQRLDESVIIYFPLKGEDFIEEGITRKLWSESSPTNSKGKKPIGDRDQEMLVLLVQQGSAKCNHKPIIGSHYTRGSPPTDGMHSIDFAELDDHIHMLIPSVLLDNGSTLNVYPLATAITLDYAPSDFGPSTQTIRAYYSTRREVMGTLEIDLLIGPTTFPTLFQVLRIPTSFNLLLGRPWIHRAGTIHYSLHQKVKFIHDGQVVIVQSVGNMFISSEPVLEISHNDDDLFLTGFTFDEGVGTTDAFGRDRWGLSTIQEDICEIRDIVDEIIPCDEYIDEMLAMSMSQIDGTIQLELASPFDLFKVSAIEIAKEIQIAPALEFSEMTIFVDDLFEGTVGPVEEIQKQLSVGFLSMVEYPEWLAKVVHVPKKDGKVRVCVDFRDLNKVSPKDDFPLPHIDKLVDSTAGHSMLSFMDRFFGDNQILMALEDMEKTYLLLPSHAIQIEECRSDLSKSSSDLRLNAKKCTFGMTSGKLLGYMVNERGIEVDLDKIRVILDIHLRAHFLTLEEESTYRLDNQCQCAFEMMREYLLSPPVLVPSTPGHLLLLYLSVSDVALGCMLAQLDDSSNERAIYYLSKRMLDYETRYVMIERYYLALVWATWRLRQYMIEYLVHLISLLDPLRYLFDRYGIGVLLIFSHGDHIPRSIRLAFSDRHPATNNIVEYEACILGLEKTLELWIRQMEVFGDFNLSQFVDALASLASMIDIPVEATIHLLLIKSKSVPAYCCLIDEAEFDDGLPWYHDIYRFLRLSAYPEAATTKDKRALR
ncbi:Transposon Ty3-G Gag-Pol polyprotein [Vitis vinifera]|uniref:Transposon Ty3-G Gag-Pol polyprotein n=1 Tax=Vitis vinifera TaxID=29760 RepID=A0A438ENC0_VITVI|nr:Transposon Ty3-G Gag-Pol polyprotein [Vitis vinifera]